MDSSGMINWEVTDSIGIMTLKNPPKNLLKVPDFIDLETLDCWIKKSVVKGIIIQGDDRHFSAGADRDNISKMAESDKDLKSRLKKGSLLLKYINDLDIPVIASIKGACFGGGLEIALCAHIRVCSRNSFFSFPETEIGLIPGLSGTLRLPEIIGGAKALEMILSAEIMGAEKAFEINLIDYIVEPDEVFNFSMNLLKKLTNNRELKVINYVIRSLNNYKKLSFENAMSEELKMFTELALDEAVKNYNNKTG